MALSPLDPLAQSIFLADALLRNASVPIVGIAGLTIDKVTFLPQATPQDQQTAATILATFDPVAAQQTLQVAKAQADPLTAGLVASLNALEQKAGLPLTTLAGLLEAKTP